MNKLAKAMAAAAAVIIFALAALYFIIPGRDTNGAQQLSAFPALDLEGYFSGDYQTSLEQAFKDQFALHDAAVGLTESSKASEKDAYDSLDNALKGYAPGSGLVPFGKVYRMSATDWLTNAPYTFDDATDSAYQKKAGEINALAANHPEAEFYVYYCTRAEDLDWFDKFEGTQSYSWANRLKELLSNGITFGKAEFSDMSDYARRMYKTDHHWNNYGAWKGYLQLASMMGIKNPRHIVSEDTFGGLVWEGSRYRECGVSIPSQGLDSFCIYEYDLPEHRTFYGDTEQSLGLREDYAAGNVVRDLSFDQYINYYGFESEPITLDYGTGTNENLLIVGDSFTRAVREQLASHFDKTVYVNFRILAKTDLNALMKQNAITKVLFIGQQDAWSGWFLDGGGEADK